MKLMAEVITILRACLLSVWFTHYATGKITTQQTKVIKQLREEVAIKDNIVCELLHIKLPPERHITVKRVKPDCPPCIYKE